VCQHYKTFFFATVIQSRVVVPDKSLEPCLMFTNKAGAHPSNFHSKAPVFTCKRWTKLPSTVSNLLIGKEKSFTRMTPAMRRPHLGQRASRWEGCNSPKHFNDNYYYKKINIFLAI
jgi:hypothetical protein